VRLQVKREKDRSRNPDGGSETGPKRTGDLNKLKPKTTVCIQGQEGRKRDNRVHRKGNRPQKEGKRRQIAKKMKEEKGGDQKTKVRQARPTPKKNATKES